MSENIKIGIMGVGRGLPEHVLTNAHLEKIVDTTDEWIQQRTGIQTRRIIGPGESILQLSVEAARRAIEHAGIEADQISYIRIGVNTHLRFPSLAVMVQKELGIKYASAADISAGCASFIFGVEEVRNHLLLESFRSNEKNYGLVIGVDGLSQITDWTDRSTCVLFGDGAGAAVLGPVKSGEILATCTRSQGEYTDLLYLDPFLGVPLSDTDKMDIKNSENTNYPFLRMDGRKVFVVAVRSMMADIRTVVDKYNSINGRHISLEDIDYVIPHQANLRIVSAVQEGLKLRQDQVYREGVINYGNTSAATIPMGYVDEWGKRPGALEVDVSFGAGFASGAILRRVAEE